MLVLPTEVLRAESRGPGMGIFYTWYYVGMAVLTPRQVGPRSHRDPGAPLTFAGFWDCGDCGAGSSSIVRAHFQAAALASTRDAAFSASRANVSSGSMLSKKSVIERLIPETEQ